MPPTQPHAQSRRPDRSLRAMPPLGTTAAVPRIPIARGYQDSSASWITTLDRSALELVFVQIFVENDQ